MKRTIILICIMLGTVLTGCGIVPKTNVIEEISPSIVIYVDRNEEGKLVQIALIPTSSEESIKYLTTDVDIMKEARNNFSRKFYRAMKSGQMRIVMISKQIAETGIFPIMNTLVLDREIGGRVFIAIVDGNFLHYIKHHFTVKPDLPLEMYLYKMFAHYERHGEYTTTNLHQFLESFYSPYADPVIPLFKAEHETLSYYGTALLQGDRMVAYINELEDVFYQLLKQRSAIQKVTPLPDLQLSIGALTSKSHISISSDQTVHIKLHLRGRIEEYQGDYNLMVYEEAEALREKIESYFEENLEHFIAKLQKLDVDPLRIGERTLTIGKRTYTEKQWREQWKKAPTKVEVEFFFDSHGVQRIMIQ